jgi:hypothetical protein
VRLLVLFSRNIRYHFPEGSNIYFRLHLNNKFHTHQKEVGLVLFLKNTVEINALFSVWKLVILNREEYVYG